jgi:Na+/H+ antiporter NhaC
MVERRGRRGVVTDYLPWLLIGIAVLAIILIAIWSMKSQGISLIDKIKNILKWGG